jgi:hypothetical protein
MPTTRRRISRGRSRAGELSDIDFLYFTWGDFFEAEDYADEKSEEELRAFWDKNKKAILKRFIGENHKKNFKGVRPWPFWKWDMPEPQREISPGDDPQKVWNHQLNIYGYFEDDFTYLKRLNLLEVWELEP